MTIRMVSVLLCAASLYAQYGRHRRFSWQEACFKNPGAPYCAGNDFAVKKTPAKDGAHKGPGVTGSGDWVPESATPQLIVVGSIDWRFADADADLVAGFNFNKASVSPLAGLLVAQLGARQGLAVADLEKILEALSSGDQVAISVRGNDTLILVTGCTVDSTFAPLENGWKAAPMLGNSLLVGTADAVDQAVERVGAQAPLSELAKLAEQRQRDHEFWAIGSAKAAGGNMAKAGLKQFSLSASVRDRLLNDAALEFSGTPDAEALRALQGATVDGNVVRMATSMDADEVRQKSGEIASSFLGEQMGTLVKAARFLPVRNAAAVSTKPVILGLDPNN